MSWWLPWRRRGRVGGRDLEAAQAREGAELRLAQTRAEGPAIEQAAAGMRQRVVVENNWGPKIKKALGAG